MHPQVNTVYKHHPSIEAVPLFCPPTWTCRSPNSTHTISAIIVTTPSRYKCTSTPTHRLKVLKPQTRISYHPLAISLTSPFMQTYLLNSPLLPSRLRPLQSSPTRNTTQRPHDRHAHLPERRLLRRTRTRPRHLNNLCGFARRSARGRGRVEAGGHARGEHGCAEGHCACCVCMWLNEVALL